MFEQKVMPIFGAMMSVSFFWRPVFRSFFARGIRNLTNHFFFFFHTPIVFSTELMNPPTNLTSLLSEMSNSCLTSPISKNTNQTSTEAML